MLSWQNQTINWIDSSLHIYCLPANDRHSVHWVLHKNQNCSCSPAKFYRHSYLIQQCQVNWGVISLQLEIPWFWHCPIHPLQHTHSHHWEPTEREHFSISAWKINGSFIRNPKYSAVIFPWHRKACSATREGQVMCERQDLCPHERFPASLLTWCTDRECSALQPALMLLCSHCNIDCEQFQWLLRSTWVHPCWCWLSCSAKLLQSWNAKVADVFGYLRKGAVTCNKPRIAPCVSKFRLTCKFQKN